ncbi:hypothetical protein SNEBB_005746, partial [Seison nebaliae]
MASFGGRGQQAQKVLVQPVNLIFKYLQQRTRVKIWIFEHANLRLEGIIVGFDEYMNLVLDKGEEINEKRNIRKKLGRILLKGDNITLIQSADPLE